MTTPMVSQIADELVTLLNTASTNSVFGDNTFTATRSYAPLNSEEVLADLTVSVIPAKKPTGDFLTRNRTKSEFATTVVVQKKLAKPEDPAEIDPLVLILDQMAQYLAGDDNAGNSRRKLPISQASLIHIEVGVTCDPNHLKNNQVFTGAMLFTYTFSGVFR